MYNELLKPVIHSIFFRLGFVLYKKKKEMRDLLYITYDTLEN